MNKINKIIFLGIILLLLFSHNSIYAQIGAQGADFDVHPMHWGRFWARAEFNKNLVRIPMWNMGNLGDARLDPGRGMEWPGTQGLGYGNQFNFFIGALITDMTALEGEVVPDTWDGKQIPIVSDNFMWARLSQVSSDRTHQQMWQPIPGFFNDGAYGWIWGISEDTDQDGELSPVEDVNFNGVLDFNLDPPESVLKSMAISTDKRTWPEFWPGGSYVGDTRPLAGRPPRTTQAGLRLGRWNGEYKSAPISDQETYYMADDHENDRWNDYFPENYWPMKKDDGTPDTTPWKDGGIFGAGIEMESRSYAWFHPLAEDLLVSLYRVRNYSDYTLDRVVTGMFSNSNAVRGDFNSIDYIVATYDDTSTVGGRSGFDIMYQWHRFPEQIETYKTIGTFGFAFLESPGIDYNGLDDDKDGLFDEAMDDGLDNDGDWRGYSDIGLDRLTMGDPKYKGPDEDGTEGNGRWDTEDTNLNGALDEGEDGNKNDRLDMEPVNDDHGTDGIGPDENNWPNPDGDGTECDGAMDLGEPNFDFTDIDEADQAGLKHVFVTLNEDLALRDDRGFWARYLEREGTNVWESDEDISFIFGARNVKLEKYVWKRFAIALVMGENRDDAVRNKATMQNIYDENYYFLTPPKQPTLVSKVASREVILYWDTDAETSKDPFFGLDFAGYRVYKSSDPSFLDIKTITDAFGNVLLYEPLVIFDKSDGLSGAHPVPFPNIGVHYDMGNDSGLKHSYRDTLVENGRTYYYAVNSIDAGNDWDFFERGLVTVDYPLQAMPSESGFNITVNQLGNVIYRDRNTAVCIPVESAAGFTEPFIDSSTVEHVSGFARGGRYDIRVYNKNHAYPGHEYEISFTDDGWLDRESNGAYRWGSTTGIRCMNVTTGDTMFNYDYGNNAYLFRSNVYAEIEKSVYEGIHYNLSFPVNEGSSEKGIEIIKTDEYGRSNIKWKKWQTDTESNLRVEAIDLAGDSKALPFDFEIRVGESKGIDTTTTYGSQFHTAFPINFTVWNVSDPNNPEQMVVSMKYDKENLTPELKKEMEGQIWDSSRVNIAFPGKNPVTDYLNSSWELTFLKNRFDESPVTPPQPGDVYLFRTIRNPTRDDTIRFTIGGGDYDKERANEEMRNIYVVPDPYVVSNTLELIYELAGNSSRRVDFVNLPPECTIYIFTASGKLVRKLYHNDPSKDFGRESWDLATEDGPEVAFGMYFFVVEAPGMDTKRGKFAIIK